MTTAVQTQSEYRNLPLVSLTESATNPRRSFDQTALSELAESIKTQGILAPLVVRPVGQHFEIVAGARRYRAAQLAGLETAPVRIVELTDAQALETSIVENLQRRDVHPLDEANGFAALMRLEEPKYSIEQIAAKCGKSAGYVASLCCKQHNCPTVPADSGDAEVPCPRRTPTLWLTTLQATRITAAAANRCFQTTALSPLRQVSARPIPTDLGSDDSGQFAHRLVFR
jgi:ParB/RepB/Spo0J family partition protein